MCLLMAQLQFFNMRAVVYMCTHSPTAHVYMCARVYMRVHGSTACVHMRAGICVDKIRHFPQGASTLISSKMKNSNFSVLAVKLKLKFFQNFRGGIMSAKCDAYTNDTCVYVMCIHRHIHMYPTHVSCVHMHHVYMSVHD